MVEKLLINFFPELELKLLERPDYCYLQPVMTQQSKTSFRMSALTKFVKRQNNKWRSHKVNNITAKPMIMVKKYSDYKGFVRGTKTRIRSLPSLSINRKIIFHGIIPARKELISVMREVLTFEGNSFSKQ